MTEEQIHGYQDAVRTATEELVDADIGPLRFDDMRFRNECEQCGRPVYSGLGVCDSCRLGPI